jgi:predicted phage replisome organizer
MSENKKYYYLKFKENYFEQDHIRVIEAMPNGHTYSLILIKLYLKSLKFDGQLRINEYIPYKSDKIDILAKVINHDADHVMHAINLAKDLGIITIMKTGEIFMTDIQNFIGLSSTEGDRKRAYRNKLQYKELPDMTNGTNSGQMSDKRPPEIELEIDIERELYGDLNNVCLTEIEYNRLIDDYGKDIALRYINSLSLYEKIGNYSDHNRTIRKWINKDGVKKIEKIETPKSVKKGLEGEWL